VEGPDALDGLCAIDGSEVQEKRRPAAAVQKRAEIVWRGRR
jgi:hypothetical protein